MPPLPRGSGPGEGAAALLLSAAPHLASLADLSRKRARSLDAAHPSHAVGVVHHDARARQIKPSAAGSPRQQRRLLGQRFWQHHELVLRLGQGVAVARYQHHRQRRMTAVLRSSRLQAAGRPMPPGMTTSLTTTSTNVASAASRSSAACARGTISTRLPRPRSISPSDFSDVRIVLHQQDAARHRHPARPAPPPGPVRPGCSSALVRGRWMRTQVPSPGSLSISMAPPDCRTKP